MLVYFVKELIVLNQRDSLKNQKTIYKYFFSFIYHPGFQEPDIF